MQTYNNYFMVMLQEQNQEIIKYIFKNVFRLSWVCILII